MATEPTAQEQLLLELLNRARLDPQAEAQRLGLKAGDVPTGSLQPLAMNADLLKVSRDHSAWEIATDTISHTGEGGSSVTERIEASDYDLIDPWRTTETLSFYGFHSSAGDVLDLTLAAQKQHQDLLLNDVHRADLFNNSFREIGIAQVSGIFTQKGIDYQASLVTENLTYSGGRYFITGVIFNDRVVKDDFYTVGEGVGGKAIALGGTTTTSGSAGGYQLAISKVGQQDLTFGAGSNKVTLSVIIGTENVKIDLIGSDHVHSSASIANMRGVRSLDLLGTQDIYANGSSASERITGNKGDNYLGGNGGNDTLIGGAGDDTLSGGSGRDSLDGGAGIDLAYLGWGSYNKAVKLVLSSLMKGPDGTVVKGVERINVTTGAGRDSLVGGAYDDALSGGAGNDTLIGGRGNDILRSGSGKDSLDGGAGSDVAYIDRSDYDRGLKLVLSSRVKATDGTVLNGIERISVATGDGRDVLTGGALDDTLNGGGGNDTLTGGDGANSLFGGDGNDRVVGGRNTDTLSGGAGNDTLISGAGPDLLFGGTGNDTAIIDRSTLSKAVSMTWSTTSQLSGSDGTSVSDVERVSIKGGAGADTLWGGTGNDTLSGGKGADVLQGGLGADRLDGDLGDDVLTGGGGVDTLKGGAGNDILSSWALLGFYYSSTPDTKNILDGGAGNDTIYGSAGDQFIGGSGVDLAIYTPLGALDGANYFLNLSGDTKTADGTVFKGIERVYVVTGGGNDTLVGGSGDDTLDAGAGINILRGGKGNDLLSISQDRRSLLDGGDGKDVAQVSLADSSSSLNLVLSDNMTLPGGTKLVDIEQLSLIATRYADAIVGGSGADNISGGNGRDSIVGGGGSDTLSGDIGDDLLAAGAGADVLFGGEGNDSLYGGAGNDTLYGGVSMGTTDSGVDLLVGGAGVDMAVLSYAKSPVACTLELSGDVTVSDGTRLIGIELLRVMGGSAADYLVGGGLDDVFVGGGGADTLIGGNGNDILTNGAVLMGGAGNDLLTVDVGKIASTLDGGSGTDRAEIQLWTGGDASAAKQSLDLSDGASDPARPVTLRDIELVSVSVSGKGSAEITSGSTADTLSGGSGGDTLKGQAGGDSLRGNLGDDSLDGGAGADSLDGGAGKDTLAGGAEIDVLTGGSGADKFIYNKASDFKDVITDFVSGEDKIIFVSGAANSGVAKGEFSLLMGSSPAAQKDLQAFLLDWSSHELWFDADGRGSGKAVLVARLDGVSALVAGDILVV